MLSRVAGKGASRSSGNGWLQFTALNAPNFDGNDSSSSANTSSSSNRLYGNTVAAQTIVDQARTNSFELAEAIGAAAEVAARTDCGRGDCNGTLVFEASNIRATKSAAGLHGGLPLQSILHQKTRGGGNVYHKSCNSSSASARGVDEYKDGVEGRVMQAGRARGLPHVSMSANERLRRARETAKWEAVGGVSVRNSPAHHTGGDGEESDDDNDDNDDDTDVHISNGFAAHIIMESENAMVKASGDTLDSGAPATATETIPLEVRTVTAKLQRKRAAIAASAEKCRNALAVKMCCSIFLFTNYLKCKFLASRVMNITEITDCMVLLTTTSTTHIFYFVCP